MSSGSVLSPSVANYMSTDRSNFLYTSPADSFSASLQQPLTRSQIQQSSQVPPQFAIYPSNADYNMYEPALAQETSPALQQTYYPTSPYPTQLMLSPQSSDQIYLTYSPKPTGKPATKAQFGAPSDTGGHYSNFYVQQAGQLGEQTATGNQFDTYQAGIQLLPQMSNNFDLSDKKFALEQATGGRAEQGEGTQPMVHAQSSQYDQLTPSASLESPTVTMSQQQLIQSLQQPKYLSSSNGSPTGHRRSGAVSLKMDEATRNRLYENILRHQQNQRLDQQSTAIDRTNEFQGDRFQTSFYPKLNQNADSIVANKPAKSSRVEQNVNGNPYGSLVGGNKVLQQQGLSTANPSYLIIRPKTNSLPESSSSGESGLEAKLAEATFGAAQNSAAWRSFENGGQQFKKQDLQGSGWRSLEMSKQTANQPDQTANDGQQSPAQLESATGGQVYNAAANGPVQAQDPLLRNSRTPSQSSVKAGARYPMDSLLAFGSKKSVGFAGPNSSSPSELIEGDGAKEQTSQRDTINLFKTNNQLEESRTNLIQLTGSDYETGSNSKNNNVIEAFDAKTNSSASNAPGAGAKVASRYDTGSIIVLPNNRSSGASTDHKVGAEQANQLRFSAGDEGMRQVYRQQQEHSIELPAKTSNEETSEATHIRAFTGLSGGTIGGQGGEGDE